MESVNLEELQRFVERCESNPSILHHPSISFFRDYLLRLGATIPEPVPAPQEPIFSPKEEPIFEAEAESVESDVDGDLEEALLPDTGPFQKMGDPAKDVSEEDMDAAQLAKSKAMDAISEDKLEEAIEHLTEAIELNPHSSLLYGHRAGLYLRLKRPNAAIRDAEAAIKLNADSARGYKSRGEALVLLRQWEAAARDLKKAASLDFDEQVAELLKTVEARVHKLEEHRKKYSASKPQPKPEIPTPEVKKPGASKPKATKFPGPMPAGMGGAGLPSMGKARAEPTAGAAGMGGFPAPGVGKVPGGIPSPSPDMIAAIMQNPELMAAFQDPDVYGAIMDGMKGGDLEKHKSNPKVAALFDKVKGLFGSSSM